MPDHAASGGRFVDVTLPLGPRTPVYPGDPATRLVRFARLETRGFNAAAIRLSVHAGTHVDAPLHVIAAGSDAASLPLASLVGPARVVNCTRSAVVTPAVLAASAGAARRVLLKTGGGAGLRAGGPGRGCLSAAAAAWLAARRVLLVGIESLSVDAPDTGELVVHRTLLAAGIVVLEGLDLDAVAAGEYQMLCLPLPLAGADGAPARVLVRRLAPLSGARGRPRT